MRLSPSPLCDFGNGCFSHEVGSISEWSSGSKFVDYPEARLRTFEFHAVFRASQQFFPHVWGKTVEMLTDNITVVFYVNKQGGAWSDNLCREVIKLWNFCIQRSVTLSQLFVSGAEHMRGEPVTSLWYSKCITSYGGVCYGANSLTPPEKLTVRSTRVHSASAEWDMSLLWTSAGQLCGPLSTHLLDTMGLLLHQGKSKMWGKSPGVPLPIRLQAPPPA